ncbi:hypothetical protein NDU88_004950 [Pleurodeles waltl]|uniref:Uncharacterized protein n=1 Tax=Pleurodeles waltl TaxID=8319 RepID=A0AAV7SKA2_PLEWA|nr:hypothetical protein NDU88_004950 [Pleurodeles waltl]
MKYEGAPFMRVIVGFISTSEPPRWGVLELLLQLWRSSHPILTLAAKEPGFPMPLVKAAWSTSLLEDPRSTAQYVRVHLVARGSGCLGCRSAAR